MGDSIVLTPGQVNLEQLEAIYRTKSKVKLNPDCKPAIEKAAAVVRQASEGDAPVYGINTGFGKLASTRIEPNQTTQLQRNLILSHCCGGRQALTGQHHSTNYFSEIAFAWSGRFRC